MANSSAAISGKSKSSPFRLRVNVTSRGVFFDRILSDNEAHTERLMVLHTTERKARRLAQWILDNTEEE